LRADDSTLRHDPRVRLLELWDFVQWNAFSTAYTEELKLPNELDEEKKRKDFETRIAERVWWGLFLDGEMISRTALNSKGEKIGQVGGVFTPKSMRQKGYAKITMLHMLWDCRDLHGHTKSILFTGETDYPAQKLYEAIGYQRIGSFALIMS
jgi:predicted GNAT family acetyltransferase